MKSFVNTYSRFVCLVALSAALAGCGSDGGVVQQVGTFIDDPVGGLTYSCVSGAQTITGTTDSAGHFNYLPGQTCTFSVGKVTLGTLTGIPSDGKVTPQDVAGVARGATAAPSALVIAQFLQSMNDGTTPGKIVIPASVTTALNSATAVTLASSSATISQADLQTLVATVPGKVLVSAATAQAALDTQISSGVVDKTAGAVSTSAPKVLNSIAITNSANPPAGLTDQLTATGYYSDGSTKDLTALASWTASSADSGTLTVGASSGLVTAVAKGRATVTASYTPSGSTTAITAKYTETVVDPTVTNLLIAYVQSGLTSVQKGATAALSAIATLSNSATQTVSSLVDWTVAAVSGGSGAASIAKSTSDGTANATLTGTTVGDVIISASYGGVAATQNLSLTVSPLLGISGTVAQGAALPDATVTATCKGGSATATTASDGSYTINLPIGTTGPCLLKADATDNAGKTVSYYSVSAPAVGDATTLANISPLTHLMASNVLGKDPSTASITTDATALTSTAITNAATVVSTSLTGLGITLPAGKNPITSQFTAAQADSGQASDPVDKAMDTLMHSLAIGSTKLSDLATNFSANVGSNALSVAATIKTALTTLASTNNIPASSSSTCPSAVSGPYVTARVGNSNLSSTTINGATTFKPNFGVVAFNFGTTPLTIGNKTVPASNVMLHDGTSYPFTNTDTNPCAFTITLAPSILTTTLTVSPAGFLVASNLSPSTSSSVNQSAIGLGSNIATNWTTSGKTDLVLGIPFQPGIGLNDVLGSWQAQEWNQALPNLVSSSTKYFNWHRKFDLSAGSSTSSLNVAVCHWDGMSSTSGDSDCVVEAPSSPTTVQLCAVRSDCPTFNGLSLSNVFDVVNSNNTIMQVAGFRAPNGDLIAIEVGNSSANLTDKFQETFGVVLRSAGRAPVPSANQTVKNPQWKVAYVSGAGEVIQALAEAYTVTSVTAATSTTKATINRTFTDTIDKDKTDIVNLDKPYPGMSYRAYQTGSFSEMVALRGNGWAISGGTATFADQLALTNSSTAMPSGKSRFFAVNLKY